MAKSTLLKIFMKIGLAMTVVCVGITTSSSAKAIVLIEDNFDTESRDRNYTNFANWNVTKGSVDIIGTGRTFENFFPSYGRYVDLDGSTRQSGTLTSKITFAFNAGDVVNISFDLAGNQRVNERDSVIVSLGSLFSERFTLAKTEPFQTFTRTINVASAITANLTFEAVGSRNISNNNGLLLDNVKLEVTPVPEPASIMGVLMFSAWSAGTIYKRKQQANKA